jgi:hypothetical protein
MFSATDKTSCGGYRPDKKSHWMFLARPREGDRITKGVPMTALPRSIRNAALMSAAAALLLAACGAAPTAAPPAAATAVPPKPTAVPVAAGPKKGGTLIAARSEDMKGLDPHKQTAFASFRMLEPAHL